MLKEVMGYAGLNEVQQFTSGLDGLQELKIHLFWKVRKSYPILVRQFNMDRIQDAGSNPATSTKLNNSLWSSMDERYIRRRKLRKFQIILATLIFVFTIIYCWNITDYDITEIQLSKFGVHKNVKHWWNISMVLIAHFLLRNVCHFLDENQRIKYNRIWKQLFGLSCLGLAIVGIVPMEAGVFDLHDVAAWGYFFMFPMAILAMAFFERKNIQHGEFLHHTWTAASMSFLPILSFELFNGFAIPEIIHSSIVLYWNLYIFLKYK